MTVFDWREAALEDRAEAGVRRALRGMADGRYAAREELDDGAVLAVGIAIDGDGAVRLWRAGTDELLRTFAAAPAGSQTATVPTGRS